MDYDVAIVGAGAAGMMCAGLAAARGRRVAVLEHSGKVGEKIRISGGGRCNFTNLHCAPEAFLSGNPRFCVSALSRYDQHDFIGLIEAHGVPWHEKTLGQLFCHRSARDVIDLLRAEMEGAALRLSCAVSRVERRDGAFRLETAEGPLTAGALVVATGGKSIPKIGASDWGLRLARQFGLAVTDTRAALVPFTLDPDQKTRFAALAGVAADVVAEAGGAAFAEAMLFTHRGLSGPAMLQISSYWREGEEIRIRFGEEDEIFARLRAARAENGRRALSTALADTLPKALAQHLAAEAQAPGPLGDISDKRLRVIARALSDWRIKPVGTEGWRTAEVMLGGVDTAGLNGKTMEARDIPGLYFIGEAVDVTGWLGGYNFQWAWSSAHAAAQAV